MDVPSSHGIRLVGGDGDTRCWDVSLLEIKDSRLHGRVLEKIRAARIIGDFMAVGA